MYTKEQKVLRLSMLLLFLALLIVYVVWYQIKGDVFQTTLHPQDSGTGIQIHSISGEQEEYEISHRETLDTTGKMHTGIIAPVSTISGNIASGKNISGNTTPTVMQANTGIKMLSGTNIYYGSVDISEKLGIKYQYALVDGSGTRYLYLGTPSYDFATIARALQGNLYTLSTEQEIIQNKLFGNKVVFINLPEYKDQEVVMLLYLNDGIWLVQMKYTLYHKSKSYLKSLFID